MSGQRRTGPSRRPRDPILFLTGPTASGKSALAVTLARRLPVEIISVDSAQVYRGMDIGTAKPSAALRARVPHHLVDILDPAEAYSAGRFRTDALASIRAIRDRGRVPLLVGGTMLYFRALEGRVDDLPAADPAVRETLRAEAEAEGWDVLHRRLAAVDPEAARRIHRNDPQRIQRALELYQLTGSRPTELYRQRRAEILDCEITRIIVAPPSRAILHERIAARFGEMLRRGLLDEVRALYERGDLNRNLPAVRAVGYRQLWEHLEGQWPLEQAINRGIVATRHLAKRQLTWLRREQAAVWLDSTLAGLGDVTEAMVSKVLADGGVRL